MSVSGPDPSGRGRGVGAALGNGVRSAADVSRRAGAGLLRGSARAAVATGRGTTRASRYTWGQARRAGRAEGAGESGLSRLLAVHVFNTAGDAAVAIALAGTLFFQVPTGEARSQVALFLALTMLPFAIVAPLIGPFLDHFSHGRRWAIGTTMAVRAFLCWVLASAVVTGSTWLFAAALGVLVSSKAYGVAKAAAVPRLLPRTFTLVKANGRVSLSGVVGVAISAPIAGLASLAGSEWALRYAFVLFVVATVRAIMLPDAVDSPTGEDRLALPGPAPTTQPGRVGAWLRQWVAVPPTVGLALRANCGPRWLSGFLTMFLAFLFREQPLDGHRPELLLAVVVGAAGLGNTLGIALAALLRQVDPQRTVVAAAAAGALVTAVATFWHGVLPLALVGFAAGLSQSLAKLSLDSVIQHDVAERIRTGTLARSDALLQFAWVSGGFVGILVPLDVTLGLGLASVALTVWFGFVLLSRRGVVRTSQSASATDGL
ncbi:MFS transporter [Nocardioides limicola]|uniref:MFS transporter n=1 Tax=Nocardioides limicola TaxID=2803368 RepID=UPI00193BE63B|nr:MFS transporter [Nocardioides sp. DJM-14]